VTDAHGSKPEAASRARAGATVPGGGLEDTPHLTLEAAMVAAGALLESGNEGVVEVADMQCRHTAMVAISFDTVKLLGRNGTGA